MDACVDKYNKGGGVMMKKYFVGIVWWLFFSSFVWAADFQINSLDNSGKLVFNGITNAASYRVEWASSPGGPWTNDWKKLSFISATGGEGAITNSIPMFFRVVAVLKADMVLIPSGTNAGSNPLAAGEDNTYYPPTYSLTVSNFYMDETPVTKEEWDAIYTWGEANGYSFDNQGLGKGVDHPVHSVSWYDSVKWCNARSERDGLIPCYTVSNQVYKSGQFSPEVDVTKSGYRLPTVTEWEYAARGGLVSQRFPNGNTISHATANYYSDSANFEYDLGPEAGYHPTYLIFPHPLTSPVRSFAPNGYGVYGMGGNIQVWCWESKYTTARQTRGGAANQKANISRCGRINWQQATDAVVTISLRCVRK